MKCRVEKVASSVFQVKLSPNFSVCSCITNDNQLNLSLIKEEKMESRGHSIVRSWQTQQQNQGWTLSKNLSLLEYFRMYMVFTREIEKAETNPFTYSQVSSTCSKDPG